MEEDGLKYLVKVKEAVIGCESFSSDVVKRIWPQMLIDFLEERMEWYSQPKRFQLVSHHETTEDDNPEGNVVAILCKLDILISYSCSYVLIDISCFMLFIRCNENSRKTDVLGPIC